MPGHGKHRRATLRGHKNLAKRQRAAAFNHDLSLRMRHLTDFATAKPCLAANAKRHGRTRLLVTAMDQVLVR